MRRAHYVVLPAAIVVTVSVESWQSLVDERTSSILDIVANVTGACLGILLAALIRLARR
jgi:glycopeptide antibiotics resistance protein